MGDGALALDGGEDGWRGGGVETPPGGRRSVMNMTVAVFGVVSLGLMAVGVLSVGRPTSAALMPQFHQYTTTITVGCGCCGAVGCYCTGQCGAVAGPGTFYGGPSLGTQAAVTPDWTDVTVGCRCCGAVGCYCTGQCGAVAGPGTFYGGPPLGTQAAVTPDWTDVMTSLTREESEDTAEIAGLKATVLRQLVLKIRVLL